MPVLCRGKLRNFQAKSHVSRRFVYGQNEECSKDRFDDATASATINTLTLPVYNSYIPVTLNISYSEQTENQYPEGFSSAITECP